MPESATVTVPPTPTARPYGTLNWPGPLPSVPHFVRNAPVLSNFWIRWFAASDTYMSPAKSTPTPTGESKPPSALERPKPNAITKAPAAVNFWIRLLPVSVTNRFPEESTATPYGCMNWPLPVPNPPILDRNTPSELNFWMRLFPVSAT